MQELRLQTRNLMSMQHSSHKHGSLLFTSKHLLLATQVFALLIEELMMEKILKQFPYPLSFMMLKNVNKNLSIHKFLVHLN